MLEPRFRWSFPEPFDVPPDLAIAGRGHGLSDRVVGLLARRGVAGAVDLDAWFADPLDGLHDPRLLPDANALVTRLERARHAGERVMVFGDFDADGLDGLAIMVIALRRFGIVVEPYVPSRLDEGHGLSLAAIRAAQDLGVKTISFKLSFYFV